MYSTDSLLYKKFVESGSSGKKIGKIDMVLFAISNFYLFLEELTHKNWPDKKFVEPVRPGRKIENSKKSYSLLFWEFIFFPKDWLIRTSLDKKFVESGSSGKKIGKIDMALFAISNFYLFLEELTHKN
ncbi:hypothetical protein [Carnobacterium maltaromaticum]|uniref:hypothetical protein n=1 Tax=Carnobacterium maltaromaticum TaxID=2751 RepID=UPI00191BC0A9|nr:hypothetical protein [Carnobacterium maltaromaticum]